jgi:hypothetical protein
MAEGCGIVTAMRRLKVLRNVASNAALRLPPKHFFTSCNPRPAAAVTNEEGLVAAVWLRRERPPYLPQQHSLREGKIMMTRAVTVALALCLIGTVAWAEPAAEYEVACVADYKKYCSIVPEEKTQFIIECLKQNMHKISDQCRKHIQSR